MAKGYAYLDKYGVLHVVEERKTAEKVAASEIEEVDIPYVCGYPWTLINDEREVLVIETDNGIYEKNGDPIPDYLIELVKKLKG